MRLKDNRKLGVFILNKETKETEEPIKMRVPKSAAKLMEDKKPKEIMRKGKMVHDITRRG